MISTSIVSPFLTAGATRSTLPEGRPAAVEAAAPQAPADSVVQSSTSTAAEAKAAPSALSFAQKSGVALMAGAALLGAGILAPATASAQPLRGNFAHAQVVRYDGYRGGGYYGGHRGIGPGAAFGLGVIGGIVGGAIVNGGVPVYPGPVYPGVPYPGVPYPGAIYQSPGYNAVGCDGMMHHFDQFGNVQDQSGFYRLVPAYPAGCYRTAPHY